MIKKNFLPIIVATATISCLAIGYTSKAVYSMHKSSKISKPGGMLAPVNTCREAMQKEFSKPPLLPLDRKGNQLKYYFQPSGKYDDREIYVFNFPMAVAEKGGVFDKIKEIGEEVIKEYKDPKTSKEGGLYYAARNRQVARDITNFMSLLEITLECFEKREWRGNHIFEFAIDRRTLHFWCLMQENMGTYVHATNYKGLENEPPSEDYEEEIYKTAARIREWMESFKQRTSGNAPALPPSEHEVVITELPQNLPEETSEPFYKKWYNKLFNKKPIIEEPDDTSDTDY